MPFTSTSEEEYIRKDAMTQRVDNIRCVKKVPYVCDKTVSTHAPIFDNLAPVVLADDLVNQKMDTLYEKQPEFIFI